MIKDSVKDAAKRADGRKGEVKPSGEPLSVKDLYISFSDAARMLGCSRQNISQVVKRHPALLGKEDGWVGILEEWVLETVKMRERR